MGVNLPVFLRRVLVSCLFPFLLLGCAQKKFYVNDIELQQKWLPFLEDGRTTKEEVRSKLSEYHGEYEDGRIWTYSMLLTKDEAARMGVSGAHWGKYNLVLVFDERNVLKRHSLVRFRKW